MLRSYKKVDVEKLIKEHKLIVARLAQPGLFRKYAPKRSTQLASKVKDEPIPEATKETSESSSGEEDGEDQGQDDKADDQDGALSEEEKANAVAWSKLG
jgi:hypothetical protein